MAFSPASTVNVQPNPSHADPADPEGYSRSKWEFTKRDLRNRYPGNHPLILKHIERAAEQLLHGQTVGRRMTPVVSFWLMRDKWIKNGVSWVVGGTDGDVSTLSNGGTLITVWPALLQLAYFKTKEGLVCQLAYQVAPETTIPRASTTYHFPTLIEATYNNDTNTSLDTDAISSASDEIYNKMASIL